MNFVRSFSMRPLWALDAGGGRVRVAAAEKRADGFRVLGVGEAAWPEREAAALHVGDCAEAVTAAMRAAENAAGFSVDVLHYNFRDPSLHEANGQGTKILSGDGQIRTADVEDACRAAKRGAGDFDSRQVYFRTAGYVIDERDAVDDPIGVFGRKLDVSVYMLFADARACEWWRRVLDRTPARRCVRVLAAWSAAYAVIPPPDRAAKRLLVDAGDVTTAFVFGAGRVRRAAAWFLDDACARLPEWAAAALAEEAGIREVLVCGDSADDPRVLSALDGLGRDIHRCAPYGLAPFDRPGDAALAGLLRVADELESRRPLLHADGGLLARARQRVTSLLNEYF
jgi:hypothetical protein